RSLAGTGTSIKNIPRTSAATPPRPGGRFTALAASITFRPTPILLGLPELPMNNSYRLGWLGSLALIVTVGLGSAAEAQNLKPWRHGVINLKSDAGFVM